MSLIAEYRVEHIEVRAESDLVFVRPRGSFEQEQIAALHSIVKQIKEQQHEPLFFLIDLRESAKVPPALRRMLTQMMAEFTPAAVAVYGANAEQRGTHALLMGALTGISGRRPNDAYFDTEAEARAWLLAERQRLLGS
jgi:hypothetical protein